MTSAPLAAATLAEDRDALQRMAGKDASAVGALYDRHARAVYSLACRILRDRVEAEDVVQEVFAQAWRQASTYDPRRATPVAWLLMIGRSRAIDRLRSRKGHNQSSSLTDALPEIPAHDEDPESHVIGADDAGRVRAALEGLVENQRKAIELAYYEGLSQSEIAERLREPLGTVKTRIRTGLLKLREALRGT